MNFLTYVTQTLFFKNSVYFKSMTNWQHYFEINIKQPKQYNNGEESSKRGISSQGRNNEIRKHETNKVLIRLPAITGENQFSRDKCIKQFWAYFRKTTFKILKTSNILFQLNGKIIWSWENRQADNLNKYWYYTLKVLQIVKFIPVRDVEC